LVFAVAAGAAHAAAAVAITSADTHRLTDMDPPPWETATLTGPRGRVHLLAAKGTAIDVMPDWDNHIHVTRN